MTTTELIARLRYTAEHGPLVAYEADMIADPALVADALENAMRPQWFYHPDYPEYCKFDPSEVIDEDYDFEPGFHVAEIQCATPLPSIWCAVQILTDDEMEALGTGDHVVCTEHATEAEARAALEKRHD